MSKTYTFNAATYKGGMNSSWSGDWNNFYAQSSNGMRIGQYNSSYAVYYTFGTATDGSTTYASLSSKPITSVTLSVPITSVGMGLPGSTSTDLPVRAKKNDTVGSGSGGTAWQSANTTALGYLRGPLSSGKVSISLGTSVPTYGYVIGPYSVNSTMIEAGSAAVLTVVTSEVDSYTVSYNANGGSGAPSSQTKYKDQTLTLSSTVPTRTGYTFLGWSTSSTATSATYAAGGSYTTNASAVLYAVWKIITYSVTYNANGGSGAPSSQTKTYGVALTLSSTAPTRTGYTFLGWATSSSATSATYCTGSSHTTNNSYTTNSAATMYAVWQAITYTVSYNKGSNGTGTNTSDTKTYNVALTLKGAIFTRTGYAQTGWATSDGGAQAYALSASYTTNAAATLYPVWSATVSTVSTSNGTLGTAQTITITRYSNSFTHDLTYKYGNATGTIATGVGASYSWTPPVTLAAQFTAAKSGTCTITCTTKSGSTTIGTSTTTCSLTIPSSVCCTVNSVSVAETVAGINSQFGGYVQGKSKVSLTGSISSGSGSPAYGATVSSYAITVNGQTLTSNGAVTGTLNSSGSNSYSFKVTDSRGYSSTKTGSFTVLAYSAPTVSATINRNAADASKVDITYSYSISPVTNGTNRNTKGLSVKYKPVGGSETTIALTASTYSGSNLTYQITGLDGNTAYEVSVIVTDYFGSVPTTTQINPTGNRVFDISPTDKTMARHGANPSDGWDHQYFNEQFHGVVDVVPRRCYATLSSAGWYRVLTFNSDSVNHSIGYAGSTIDFNIGYKGQNETHKISLHIVNGNVKFDCENSVSYSQLIDKIRYTVNGAVGYVDLHILGECPGLYVDFIVHDQPTKQYQYIAASLSNVGPSPSGETVVATFAFSKNSNAYTSVSLNGKAISAQANTTLHSIVIPDGATRIEGTANIRLTANITKMMVSFVGATNIYHNGDYLSLCFNMPVTAGSTYALTTYLYDSTAASIQSGSLYYRFPS